MNKRPLSVTAVGWLFGLAGAVGLAYHGSELAGERPFRYDLLWVCLVRLAAVVGAVFLVRRQNWARWLLTIWMAYHVGLSAFHKPSEFVVHALLLGVVVYCLFRPRASAYFRGADLQPAPIVTP